jgi:hypothetical protein
MLQHHDKNVVDGLGNGYRRHPLEEVVVFYEIWDLSGGAEVLLATVEQAKVVVLDATLLVVIVDVIDDAT